MGASDDPHLRRMELARYGEDLAGRYLESRGVRILERNLTVGQDEIDLLAVRGTELLVVEVKSRRGDGFGHGAEAVTGAKLRRMRRATVRWLEGRDTAYDVVRFFVVEVDTRRRPHRMTVCEVE